LAGVSAAPWRDNLERVVRHPLRYRSSAVALAVTAILSKALIALAASPAWIDTRQVGPFVFQATFSLAAYEPLFAELPELQRELSRTLGIPDAKDPIYVYLFSDAEQYRAYQERHFPRLPYRPALFIKDRGIAAIYTYRKPELYVDLRHECTHALLHSALPVVPLWLDEGLAKYFEMPADQRAFDHPYFYDLKWKWSLRLGMVRTLDSLEERTDLSQMEAADYRSSWAWVHFMLHGPEAAHRALVEQLAVYRRWEPTDKLSARLKTALPNANEQLIQHFKHWHR
jgi:hypothetical protein